MKKSRTLQNRTQKLRRPSLRLLLLSAVMLFLAFPVFAQSEAATKTLDSSSILEIMPNETDTLNKGRDIIKQFMDKTGTPGVSVAVKVRDSLVWTEGFGLADVEHNVPVRINTKFRAASVSKSLTSVSVGLLHEQGLLDLDVAVQTYVPAFPEKEHPITTRQLGAHQSGLPHYQEEDFVNLIHYESVMEALNKFKDRPLLFKPGERYHYSKLWVHTNQCGRRRCIRQAVFGVYERSCIHPPRDGKH